MNDNLFTRLARPAGAAGMPFLVSPNDVVSTYADLDRASARVANALIAQGLAPGDRVVAQIDKGAEAIVLYLATLRAGGVYLPLNTAYTLAELEYFLSDSQPRILVCTPAMHAGLAALAEALGVQSVLTLGADGSGSGSLPALSATQISTFDDVPRSARDLAAILYTSGTTGRSKGAMLTHGNLVSNALVLREYWRYGAQDCLLHALPIFHIHGLFVAVNITLAAGASLRLLPRFDPDLVFAQLPHCSVMMGVPTFYVRLLDDTRLTRAATAHMRLFVSGSAPLLDATHRAWHGRTGHAILERYGMTETSMNTSNPYDGERVPGTVGLPLPGVAVRVVDQHSGGELPCGSTGMIEVRGPNVFAGYWRNPEKTRAEFRADGYFITGDLGQIDARGYVRIVGRGKDLIISGGYNVYPKEVETELDALPGVLESAVIGLPHHDFGEAVTAAVMAPDRTPECNEATMIAALKQRLAAYKCPKRVLFVDELPRNPMGKVQKNLLRQQYAHLYSNDLKDSL
jgi:malonyl-CoA/methylmalonyl-CoA synthetase